MTATTGNNEPTEMGDDGGTGETTRVFVYGTLKAGKPNHYLLEGCKHLGDCVVGNNFAMVNMGWFPGVVRGPDIVGSVHGEVYEVDLETLHSLDILEGHPTFFKRHKIRTDHKNAWIYLVPTKYGGQDGVAPRITSGLWEGAKCHE